MKNTTMIVVKAVLAKKGVVEHTVHSGQLSQKNGLLTKIILQIIYFNQV